MRTVRPRLSLLSLAVLFWNLAFFLAVTPLESLVAAQDTPVTPSNRWVALNPAAPDGGLPSTRSSHTLIWDDGRGQLILFGGVSFSPYTVLSDIWIYQPVSNSWMHPALRGFVPAGRQFHTAVWDTFRRQMLVFGGNLTGHNDAANDLWSFQPDTNSWKQLRPAGIVPPARAAHSAVWDMTNQQMLVFGGTTAPFANEGTAQPVFNDVWAFRPASNTWVQLRPKGRVPSARYAQTAIWDTTGQQMLVFGGTNGAATRFSRLNDLWSYQPRSNRWIQLHPRGISPSPRAFQGSVLDTVNRQMVIYGGEAHTPTTLPLFNDLYAYNLAANSWIKLPNDALPTEPHLSPIAWDTVVGRILLFGGVGYRGRFGNSRPQFNDTWSYLLRR